MNLRDHPLIRVNNSLVRAWKDEEAVREVRAVLDGYAPHELDNYDKLILAGINLAATGHQAADRWATTWASEQPTPERLEIVANLTWDFGTRGCLL